MELLCRRRQPDDTGSWRPRGGEPDDADVWRPPARRWMSGRDAGASRLAGRWKGGVPDDT
jgi:hypothetical protein